MRTPGAEPRLAEAGRAPIREKYAMAKRANKRRGRKKKKANHGKRPNT